MSPYRAGLAERLERIHERMARAQALAGTTQISLVAASKKQPLEHLRAAAQLGLRAFGENYVQEGIAKRDALNDPSLQWHHIGPIQSNKCADIARNFDWAQGVDRLRVAERLSGARPAGLPPLNVCVQVNICHEGSKSGVTPQAAGALCEAVQALPGLKLRGLMTIPAPAADSSAFEAMRALYERLRDSGFNFDTLSMGMSDDFEQAIAAGATMVRIGSALFGPRQ